MAKKKLETITQFKRKAERDFMRGLLISLCITLAIALFFKFATSFNLKFIPVDYKIYKTECHNETIKTYYSLSDLSPISCPKSITLVPCYDSRGNLIKELTCEKNTDICYKIFNKKFNNSQYNILTRKFIFVDFENNEAIFRYFWLDNNNQFTGNGGITGMENSFMPLKDIEIKEVCQDKEVEEININLAKNIGYVSDHPPFLQGLDDKKVLVYIEGELHFIIKKSEITKEWLNKACQCIENIKYTRNSAENSMNVPCSKYKCGDYTVVKQ